MIKHSNFIVLRRDPIKLVLINVLYLSYQIEQRNFNRFRN
jgi:hypothetical protein